MVLGHLKAVKEGKINVTDYIRSAVSSANEINGEYHYFSAICKREALEQAKEVAEKLRKGKAGKLAGLPVSVKDNICVKGVETTAGSSILKGYKPVFDATVVERLKKEDAIIIGKTAMDEFGFGSFGVNVGRGFSRPLNPHDKTRSAGGSSGGAGGITSKAGFVHVALGESTGGSIENPASYCGVVGFCPTYGRVSRWGLISYADSLDKIGILAKNAADIAPVLEVISGFDEKDGTSLREELGQNWRMVSNPKIAISSKTGSGARAWKVGIIKESLEGLDREVSEATAAFINKIKQKGIIVQEVSLPFTFKYCVAAYYIIATSESSTNLARFCGLRYGIQGNPEGKTFEQYFPEIRSRHFNEESKRRIILGTFARMAGYREAFYLKAAKVRRMIIDEHRRQFADVDVLLSPTMPTVAPKFDDISKLTPLQIYLMDILNLGLNLAGLPHASFPIAGEGAGKMNSEAAAKPGGRIGKSLPIGMTASMDQLEDGKLLNFLEMVRNV